MCVCVCVCVCVRVCVCACVCACETLSPPLYAVLYCCIFVTVNGFRTLDELCHVGQREHGSIKHIFFNCGFIWLMRKVMKSTNHPCENIIAS